MKYFIVSYIKIRSGKVQMCNTVEKAESLHELYVFFMRCNRVIIYVDEITSEQANDLWDIEKTQKNPYEEREE